MGILQLFLTALGLSVDAFTVSFTGGILTKKQKLKNALIVGAYFSVVQTSVASLGWFLGSKFKSHIAAFSEYFAVALLMLIGIRMIFQYIKERKEEFEAKELNPNFFPLLALVVSFDELAAGVSFGIFQVHLVEAIFVLSITFFITAFLGILVGRKLGLALKKRADLIGGTLFIVLSLTNLL